jgi:hypothetical protein
MGHQQFWTVAREMILAGRTLLPGDLLSPADDGSVRVVCTVPAAIGGLLSAIHAGAVAPAPAECSPAAEPPGETLPRGVLRLQSVK